MLFHDDRFLFVFLPLVLIGFLLINRSKHSDLTVPFLIASSVVFYVDQGWIAMLALLGSVVFNKALGDRIAGTPLGGRKPWLVAGIMANLALLAWFKYTNFFLGTAATLSGISYSPLDIILPAGISFHTFQQIAYLVDTTREPQRYTWSKYGLFVIFFPQFVAGPIVHHREMLPQLNSLVRHQPLEKFLDSVGIGLAIFVIGLAKKILIADRLAPIVDGLWQQTADGSAPTLVFAWIGAVAYALQLYFDFSGYSDMAIGLARCFGLRLPENFLAPYRSISVSDFWRRWHITLGRFLREYLYIPLGGNRRSGLRNIVLTMILGGLWHGANWTFLLWGAMHGVAMALERIAIPFIKLPTVLKWFLTLLFIVIAWVPFRAPTIGLAWQYWTAMAGLNGIELPERQAALLGLNNLVTGNSLPYRYLWQTAGWEGALAFCVGIAIALGLPKQQGSRLEQIVGTTRTFFAVTISIILLALFALTLFFKDRNAAFLYFQF